MESSYPKFTKDVLIIGIANALIALSGIILLPLIAKTLGAGDYGIWTQVNVTTNLALTFGLLGLPLAMTRFLAAEKNNNEIQEGFYSIFSFVFLTTLIISFLLIILSNSIAKAFFNGASQVVIITGIIILVSSSDLVCVELFRTFQQMRKYALFITADIYAQTVVIACLVLNGYGLFSILLSVLAIKLILFFALFFLIKSQIGIKKPHFSRIKEYLSFALPFVPSNIASWIVASSNRYAIGYFLGVASVGVFSAGYAIGSIPYMMAVALGIVLTPALSKLYDESRMNEVKTYLSYSLKYLLALAIPFVFGAAILAKSVLSMFSTSEIAAEGYFVLPLVALGTLFLAIYVLMANILILVKRTKVIGATWILCALINLGLNILVVPRIGILGAAISTLISYALVLGLTIYYSLKEIRFNIEWSFVLKSLIASIIMSLVIWKMDSAAISNVILTVSVGVIVYAAALVLFKGFKRREWQFARELFQKHK